MVQPDKGECKAHPHHLTFYDDGCDAKSDQYAGTNDIDGMITFVEFCQCFRMIFPFDPDYQSRRQDNQDQCNSCDHHPVITIFTFNVRQA